MKVFGTLIRILPGLFMLGVCIGSVSAQSTRGIIAGPIDSDAFDLYARMLRLSEPQRNAAAEALASYTRQYEQFRNSRIATFLEDHPDFRDSSTDFGSDAAPHRDAARDLAALHGSLRTMDSRFFDAIVPLLSDLQAPVLPRVRQWREIDRLIDGPARRSYDAAVGRDLLPTVLALRDDLPTDDARTMFDLAVDRYRQRLRSRLKDLHEFGLSYNTMMADQLATELAADPTNDELGDFVHRANVIRSMQEQLTALTAEVRAVHREFVKDAGSSLSPDAAEQLREAWLQAYYRDVPSTRGPAAVQMGRLIDHPELVTDLRELVAAEQLSFNSAADRLIMSMVDVVDERTASNATHSIRMSFGEDDPYVYADRQAFDRQVRSLTRELHTLNRETIERLIASLTGADAGARAILVLPPPPQVEESLFTRGLHSSISTNGEGLTTYGYQYIPLDMLKRQFGLTDEARPFPPAISKTQLDRWLHSTALRDDALAIIDVLHEDYLATMRGLEATGAIRDARAMLAGLFERDAAQGNWPRIPKPAQIERLFSLKRRAHAAVLHADAAFFDSLQVALGDALPAQTLASMQNTRRRHTLLYADRPQQTILFNFSPDRFHFGATPADPRLDMADVFATISVPPKDQPLLVEQLAAYERDARALTRAAYDAAQDVAEHRALLMATHLRTDPDHGLIAEGIAPTDDDLAIEKRLTEAYTALRALNERTRDALLTLFPDNSSTVIRAYNEAGWPQLYLDESPVARALNRAQDLDDLTVEQRLTIQQLTDDYTTRWRGLGDAIIAAGDDTDAIDAAAARRQLLQEQTTQALKQALPESDRMRVFAAESDSP